MTDYEKALLIADFTDWSGGFEPHELGMYHVAIYIEASLPKGYDDAEAKDYLASLVTK